MVFQSASKWVIGSDECGLGSWAGPLTVCGVLVRSDWHGEGAADSKGVSRKKRRQLHELWTTTLRLKHSLVSISAQEIDRNGLQASLLSAHKSVIETLLGLVEGEAVDVIVDGLLHLQLKMPGVRGFPNADVTVPAVGAASILGKVTHDLEMERLASLYPAYGFDENMGYGTKAHIKALSEVGLCPEHRRSINRVAAFGVTKP